MQRLTEANKLTVQFFAGLGVIVAGLVLLFLGFYAVPIGAIDPTVLTAFGEAATFAGALIGIDYSYKFKVYKEDRKVDKNEE